MSSTNRTEQLKQWDHTYLWHPFTQMREWLAEEPVIIERGEGNYLFDTEGNRYFDGVSSLWCTVHGHGRKEIVDAITNQAQAVAHTSMLGLVNVPAAELGKRLIDLAPEGLKKVFYSDSGASAVEAALKMAMGYWQHRGEPGRDLYASLTDSYHGDTVGGMSVGYSEWFDRPYRSMLFPVLKLNPPHFFRYYRNETMEMAVQHALEEAGETLRKNARRLAAVIVEPLMQGAAGMWNHPVEYLQGLHRLCREHRVLMIADEVAVGIGRTGRMFACEHAGISPDLMCLGKGLSGGVLPLAATLTSQDVFDAFLGDYEEGKTFFHGHTYTGNPVACAAAGGSLEVFEKDSVLARLQERIPEFSRFLQSVQSIPHVADIRQCGYMVGIELAQDVEKRRSFPMARRMGVKVILAARKRGLLIRPLGDVIILNPPLSTTAEQLQWMVETTAESIREVVAQPGS